MKNLSNLLSHIFKSGKKKANDENPGITESNRTQSESHINTNIEVLKKKEANTIPEPDHYQVDFTSPGITLYNNNFEHIFEEIYKIDLIIRNYIENNKDENHDYRNDFMGLYISDDEINNILKDPLINLKKRTHFSEPRIETISTSIENKKMESKKKGIELRIPALSDLFGLKQHEVQALLLCLAPELDSRYGKLYSYMQDDITKKRPSIDIVIRLLFPSIEDRFKSRNLFYSDAPLLKYNIIHLSGEGTLLSRSIKIDDRVVNFLLENDAIDPVIRSFSKLIKPEISSANIISNNVNTLMEMIKGFPDIPYMFYFNGPYGTGKKMTAEAVCRELHTNLLVVDSKALVKDPFETIKLILREARLQGSSLFFENFDTISKVEGLDIVNILKEIDEFPSMVFLSGERPWEPVSALKKHRFLDIAFSLPVFEVRKKLWDSFLGNDIPEKADIDLLSSKFILSGGQIKDAITSASNLALLRKNNPPINMDDLYRGARMQTTGALSDFAKNIKPRYTWKEIILPDDTKEQLKEISGYIRFRGTVYGKWGFDRKLSLGKGLNALFSGPSGTGKTMAAEVITNEAELELYKIDLSSVVSKYIGETEKNLKNIFKEAENSNTILLFDEADALFGKRSEVRDSHDRYANIEINYLLQKMEEYEGIVILATNFNSNIDEAFLRRMHFKIDFPSPDEKLREKIWRNIFPDETPVSEDVNFGFLSKFKITGGNIKNIALSAAFLAASNSGTVDMEHIIRSTKREFNKMGKHCSQDDFKEYYHFVK